jgi:hypothetical protein
MKNPHHPPVPALETENLLEIIDTLLVYADVRRYGPGGVNMHCIRRAYDAIQAGVQSGVRPLVTVAIAHDMRAHGWDLLVNQLSDPPAQITS